MTVCKRIRCLTAFVQFVYSFHMFELRSPAEKLTFQYHSPFSLIWKLNCFPTVFHTLQCKEIKKKTSIMTALVTNDN